MKKKGSLTIEAAFILPWMLFVFITFAYLIEYIFIQVKIEQVMYDKCEVIASYGYAIDNNINNVFKNVTGVADSLFVSQSIKNEIDKSKFMSSIVEHVDATQSKILDKDKNVALKVTYLLKTPFSTLGIQPIKVTKEFTVHGWVGYTDLNKNTGDDTVVYITPNGTVYHATANCTHLKLTVYSVLGSKIKDKRNEDGAKYYACEKCVKNKKIDMAATYYLAREGNRYHLDSDCSGLKRTVKSIKLSEVGSRRACSRCVK